MTKTILTLAALLLFWLPNQAQFYLAGTADLNGGRGLYVQDTIAYVADGSSGLRIFNVSDAENPILLSTFSYAGANAADVALNSNYIFIADAAKGLIAVDVTNPANPVIADSISDFPVSRISLSNNHAFCVKGNKLYIFDVNNATAMAYKSSFTMPGNAFSDNVFATYPYVHLAQNGSDGGFEIVNANNITSPARISFTQMPGFGFDVHVMGAVAFVAEAGRIRHYNINWPAEPYLMRVDSVGGKVYHLFATKEDSIFTINGSSLVVYNINKTVYDTNLNLNYGNDIFVSNGNIYIAADSLYIFKPGQKPIEPVSVKQNIVSQPVITVFPNPAQNKFSIKITGCNQTATVFLTDLKGSVLLHKQIPSGTNTANFDVKDLQSGVYLLKLQTADSVTYGKLIIE